MSRPSAATDLTRYPAGRYGRRRDPNRRRSRWPLIAIGAVMIIVSLLIAWSLFDRYGPQDYTGTVVRWSDVTDHQIVITFDVIKPDDRPATCIVRARGADGAEVGYAQVDVPAPGTRQRVTYTLATTARPVTGEVPRCSAK